MIRGNQYQDRFNEGVSSFEITKASSQSAYARLIDDFMAPGFLSSSSSSTTSRGDIAPRIEGRAQQLTNLTPDYPWYLPAETRSSDQPRDRQRPENGIDPDQQFRPQGEPAWKRYWRAAQENHGRYEWGDMVDPYQQRVWKDQQDRRDLRHVPLPHDVPLPQRRPEWTNRDWANKDRRDRDRYDRNQPDRQWRDKQDRQDWNAWRDGGRDRFDPRDNHVPIPRPRRDFVDNDRQRDWRVRDDRFDRRDRDYAPPANDGEVSERQGLIARAARRVASEMGSVGWCARGVQRALARAGLPEFVGSGNAWQMLKPMMRSGKFDIVPASEVREGDIALRKHPGGHGHIAVMLGQDRQGRQIEASDHITVHRPNHPRYSQTVYLRHRV